MLLVAVLAVLGCRLGGVMDGVVDGIDKCVAMGRNENGLLFSDLLPNSVMAVMFPLIVSSNTLISVT